MKFNEKTYVEALNRLANTDDGKVVLSAIKHMCNWDMTILTSDDATQSLYYAARRGVYGGIRKHIEPEHLKVLEHDYNYTPEVRAKDAAG